MLVAAVCHSAGTGFIVEKSRDISFSHSVGDLTHTADSCWRHRPIVSSYIGTQVAAHTTRRIAGTRTDRHGIECPGASAPNDTSITAGWKKPAKIGGSDLFRTGTDSGAYSRRDTRSSLKRGDMREAAAQHLSWGYYFSTGAAGIVLDAQRVNLPAGDAAAP